MDYVKVLSKDKKLASLLAHTSITLPELRSPLYLSLIRSVVSQQISTRVARVIFDRLLSLLPLASFTLDDFDALSIADLKAVGLSTQKAHYVHNIVHFFREHQLTDDYLHTLSDDELIRTLTQIKGIGIWSVHMLLMFSMQRTDVFPLDDLGIQEMMRKHYLLSTDNQKTLKEQMNRIAQKWQPYRTYACLYLWAAKDKK